MLPEELVEDIKSFNCVLFAGAGTTTEQPYFRRTFLEHMEERCRYPKRTKPQSFPEVMQYYCSKVDGGNKNRLLREIIDWIEAFSAEGEDHRVATHFFREVARIPFFRIIVTTNWDPFCERCVNVLVPMVEDQDIPFWDENKRQVLKIHGCITRPHTIVATLDDYNACMKDRSRGAVFTKLRDLMATKSFVFVGYSIRDPDFRMIYDEVINNLGPFRRGAYIIDPNPKDEQMKDWGVRNVKVLKVSGIAFAEELARRLEKDKLIPSRELISHFDRQLGRIINIHMRTSDHQELPEAFSSAMYQDGLIHSLEHVIEESRTGKLMKEFSTQLADFKDTLDKYERAVTRYGSKPNDEKTGFALVEVAYWSGRVEALKRFASRNTRDIPAFFSPNSLKPVKRMARLAYPEEV